MLSEAVLGGGAGLGKLAPRQIEKKIDGFLNLNFFFMEVMYQIIISKI